MLLYSIRGAIFQADINKGKNRKTILDALDTEKRGKPLDADRRG